MTYDQLADELTDGARVALMLRHAERPPIDPNDPTFGETLALTPAGEEAAFRLGRVFAPFAGETEFHTSPMNRTRTTARRFAAGMGLENPPIPEHDELGNGSFYFADQPRVHAAFGTRGDVFRMMADYVNGKPLDGCADRDTASDFLEAWVDAHHAQRFSVLATHDLFNAAFLSARGAARFTADRWICFLGGAAIIDRPGHPRSYAYLTWE